LLGQFGSLEGLYARLNEVARAKLRETLAGAASDALLSQKLVSLKDDIAVDFSLDQIRFREPNGEELRKLFTELDFTRQLDGLKKVEVKQRHYEAVMDASVLEKLIEHARVSGRVGIDTETTSLDAMSASLVGLSFAWEEGKGYYVPVAHRYLGAPKQIPWEQVRALLAPLLADENVLKIGHHLKFDALVLARHGAPVRGPVFDTMIGSYLLDPETPNGLKELARRELGVTMTTYDEVTKKQKGHQMAFEDVSVEEATAYAAADAEISYALMDRFDKRLEQDGLRGLFHDVELPLSQVLLDMEMTGVLVDVGKLQALGQRVDGELRGLEAKAKQIVGHEFSVRSRDQLEKILFDELGLPVVKRTPKGGRSTDAEVLEELAEKHELPKVIVEFRELDKLKGTYIEALPRCVNPSTGRIHTRFSQTTAATGRLASHDPNLQNIPIRTAIGKEIRAAFVAPPGYTIVSADYSQIELRVLAHLAQDPELLEAFRTGEDVHVRTARLIFGVDAQGVTSEMRRRAKTINFGVIYGMGDAALAKSLGIPKAEAARFIEAYFERYAGVTRFMQRTVEAARNGEAVRTVLGRRRFLPNLHSANRGLRMEAERIAKNTAIQGTAADILKVAMVRLGQSPVVPGARMILTVHDELVFEIPDALVDEASGRIREAMEGAMELDVPLLVEVGAGPNWAEAH
jgi:DNA polymerase-1